MQFNTNLIDNQDPYSQIGNDETPGAEYPNESDSENEDTNRTSALSNFMPQILADHKTAEGIICSNSPVLYRRLPFLRRYLPSFRSVLKSSVLRLSWLHCQIFMNFSCRSHFLQIQCENLSC